MALLGGEVQTFRIVGLARIYFRSIVMTTRRSLFVLGIAWCLSLVMCLSVVPQSAQAQSGIKDNAPEGAYAEQIPGILYLQMRPGFFVGNDFNSPNSEPDPIHRLLREIGTYSVELFDKDAYKDSISVRLGIDRIYTIMYSQHASPIAVVIRALATGEVETASPRYIFKEQVIGVPNDPGYSEQYYMQNIHMEGAWNAANTMGDSSMILADIDAGVNYNHEDLAANIQINWGETGMDALGHDKRTNGIDDDGNGVIDDVYGYDAAGETTDGQALRPDGNPYPEDQSYNGASHGTMTTGCMVAVGNNKIGICGPAAGCHAYPIKIGNALEHLTAAYEGVHWAAAKTNCKVLNNSWGGLVNPQALAFAAIFPAEVEARGKVMVASAGNYSLNNDNYKFYPADMPGVLSVGATDINDNAASFTHFGRAVSVFAPGVNIKSTFYTDKTHNSEYTEEDGTSFSGPITSGVVGLLMVRHPKWSPKFIIRQIAAPENLTPIKNHSGDPLWSGIINAEKAMKAPGFPGIDILGYRINTVAGAPIDGIGSATSVNVDFHNYVDPGLNFNAYIEPGAGYTWPGYDPMQPPPSYLIGNIDSFATVTGSYNIIRTGRFSEGALKVNFYLDGQNEASAPYHDTLHAVIPLTKKTGLTSQVATSYGTGIKMVDKTYGWASFGYYVTAPVQDNGPKRDTTILVGSYSKRKPNGTWTLPQDVTANTGEAIPAYAMDATDKDHAWFACQVPGGGGGAYVVSTPDGGATFNSSDVTSIMPKVRSIHMFDATNGIIIGDATSSKWAVGYTNDGGATWTAGSGSTAKKPGDSSGYGASCWVGDKGWYGTSNLVILTTTDRGQTWKSYPPSTSKSNVKNCTAIGFADDGKTGFAVYRPTTNVASDGAALFFSNNGGFTWSPVNGPDANFIGSGVAFIPGTTKALITSNEGVFEIDNPSANPSWNTYLGAPSTWDAATALISVTGDASNYTVGANSGQSGVTDFSTIAGDVKPAVQDLAHSIDLIQNAPNPLRDETTIYFRMAKTDRLRIAIYDMLGRQAAVVYEGQMAEGSHAIPVNAGLLLPGVYRYAIESASGERITRSMTVIR